MTANPSITNGGTPSYQWKRGGTAISGATALSYTLVSADVGYTISVTVTAGGPNYKGSITSEQTSTVLDSGDPITGTIVGYYPKSPASATILNFTGFTESLAGVEARVALNGTSYGDYAPIEVDSRGRAMILLDPSSATTAAKVQFRMKETATKLAGPMREISISERDLAIGDYYQGGIVGYIFADSDPGYVAGQVHGLIAAKQDLSSAYKWSEDTEYNGSIVGTSTALRTGLENTNSIKSHLGASASSYAAGAARDYNGGGYDDWFLPSWNELNKVRDNRLLIGNFITTAYSVYWTSSESTQGGAYTPDWTVHSVLLDGSPASTWWVNRKTDQLPVRPVRYF